MFPETLLGSRFASVVVGRYLVDGLWGVVVVAVA